MYPWGLRNILNPSLPCFFRFYETCAVYSHSSSSSPLFQSYCCSSRLPPTTIDMRHRSPQVAQSSIMSNPLLVACRARAGRAENTNIITLLYSSGRAQKLNSLPISFILRPPDRIQKLGFQTVSTEENPFQRWMVHNRHVTS